ncbi:glycosyltransferase [Nocardia terpenica]|uniref:glycosyltransferase n=1 Tax=Nocardia terpenica TaxID=455432 RepID=UPI0018943A09|nr:glycosyltransferase [Nocardia terpenica]MBF6062766.1 glycosyltransferase [Nocardia terpenica]MBF6105099.1 glycosyltransferase [Nocardia terpenica]MBF6112464.1 glycosyltransferase [Nocardia terpenica]MBF6118827.1 glycosyltransferase [Nocardia terpenica]MBF6154296.1 glycosyltransferase [Nocardia terpenica]
MRQRDDFPTTSPIPAVTVVVPAHLSTATDLAHLDEQLAALAAQDYRGALEVLVADNGSPVDLRDHLAHRDFGDLKVRHVDASAERGASAARNIGAAHADTPILLFCDHDDRVRPDWASRLVEFLGDDHDVVSSAVEGRTLNTANPRHAAEVPAPEDFQPPGATAPTLLAGSMACRTTAFRELGGFDTGYTANEDVEFGWRAHRAGYRTGFLPAALVAYRYRTTFRAGYRQGRARGIGLARLHRDHPRNGLPPIRFPVQLLTLAVLAVNPRLTTEERGLLLGITVGQTTGGLRYRTLRWW